MLGADVDVCNTQRQKGSCFQVFAFSEGEGEH